MKILILGANGQVGSELVRRLQAASHEILTLLRKEYDFSKPCDLRQLLDNTPMDIMINAAAYTAVDKAEDETALARQVNALIVEQLAIYCQLRDIPLIHLSTDYVFDGLQERAYTEEDRTNPVSCYGKTKLEGETYIRLHCRKHIILRTSWVFGCTGQNFVKTIIHHALSKPELNIVADQWGCPTAAKDLARVIEKIIDAIQKDGFEDWGTYHYSGFDNINWYGFAKYFMKLASAKGLAIQCQRINPIASEDYPVKAMRPKNSVLNTQKIEKIFHLERHNWKDYLTEVIDGFVKEESLP